MTIDEIQETMRDRRRRLGISQIDMGKYLGCSRQTVYGYEKGFIKMPKMSAIAIEYIFSRLEWTTDPESVRLWMYSEDLRKSPNAVVEEIDELIFS